VRESAKRSSALKWTVVERMIWAWILTIPIAGTIAFLLMEVLQAFGYGK
jgi:PiT family inorganic phosphate transporter